MLRAAVLLLCTALATGPATARVDFTGTWTVLVEPGPWTLRLEETEGGGVTGSLTVPGGGVGRVRGTIERDEEDEWAVEGTIEGPAGRHDFDFSPDEDGDFLLLLIPHDAIGTPRMDRAALLQARPGAPATAPDLPAADGHPLVGLWSTQVVMNAPEGSVATELRMEFRADGTVVDLGSRALGSLPGAGLETGWAPGAASARWRTRGEILEVRQEGTPWVPLASFHLEGDRLLLIYHDGDRGLWHRRGP